jgi:hypothetical protein
VKMPKEIEDGAQRSRAAELVDKMLGYPRQADARGSRCPPAPFGATQRYNVDRDGPPPPGRRVYEVSDAVAAMVAALSGAERAELNSILAAATSVAPSGEAVVK